MRLIEFLDRMGITLTNEESRLIHIYEKLELPMMDWVALFDNLGIRIELKRD